MADLCPACTLPRASCPHHLRFGGSCRHCFTRLRETDDTADGEWWQFPLSTASIPDAWGTPLTWYFTVCQSHSYLARHAYCDTLTTPVPCHCQWHPVEIDRYGDHLTNVRAWPGPVCGNCWHDSCGSCGVLLRGDSLVLAHRRLRASAAFRPTVSRPSCAPPFGQERYRCQGCSD